MVYINERTELGKYITIDRERDLVLTYSDQIPRESIYIFEFSINKKIFIFWARQLLSASTDRKTIVKWSVIKIQYDKWGLYSPEIHVELAAALNCYAVGGAAETNRESIKEVIVEFQI